MDSAAPAPPRSDIRSGLVAGWVAFWLLMIGLAVLEYLRHGGRDLWRPLLAEGTAFAIASGIALLHWRLVARLDPLLGSPWRWFARVLPFTPLVAFGFVVALYGLRYVLHWLFGLTYRHEPWAQVLVHEMLKFSLFFVLFTAVVFGIRSYLAWAAARIAAERERALARQAQLLQLTQQLQPHFLFNALNTISSLIHTDPERADSLLNRLAALLRAATDLSQRPQQPLADEIALLRAYAAIMVERFGDRVRLEWDIDERAAGCMVPTLCLQPLLENAFCHAVEKRREPTQVRVCARLQAGRLQLEVADDGGQLPARPQYGVGLRNLQQRLQAMHGA
ncbi:MAG TPA: histidine kinase, partial [Burkholderiaceae bacterium]|nr:histidine kinase [Burkholderiaceae bacterium]